MFASFAHHLRAAGISLDGDGAHGAPLDVLRLGPRHPHGDVPHQPGLGAQHGPALAGPDQGRPVLCTGEAGVPGAAAQGTELLDAGGAGDRHTLGLVTGADVTDGVTPRLGTPRPVGVQRNFCKYHSVTKLPNMPKGLGLDQIKILSAYLQCFFLPVFSLKVRCFSINCTSVKASIWDCVKTP